MIDKQTFSDLLTEIEEKALRLISLRAPYFSEGLGSGLPCFYGQCGAKPAASVTMHPFGPFTGNVTVGPLDDLSAHQALNAQDLTSSLDAAFDALLKLLRPHHAFDPHTLGIEILIFTKATSQPKMSLFIEGHRVTTRSTHRHTVTESTLNILKHLEMSPKSGGMLNFLVDSKPFRARCAPSAMLKYCAFYAPRFISDDRWSRNLPAVLKVENPHDVTSGFLALIDQTT